MKKSLGKLFLFITVALCLFFVPGISGIRSNAANGDLVKGVTFNETIKSFNYQNPTYNTNDYIIKRIVFEKQASNIVCKLPRKSVGTKVYAYYDASDNTVYIRSKYKIKFNKNCFMMFIAFEGIENIDFGKGVIDTRAMEKADYMFRCCANLKTLNLSEFKTPNLVSMGQMFHNCCTLKELDLSSFNTAKVKDMQSVFAGNYGLESINLKSFNTSKVESMSQTFAGCSSLKTLDLSNFDTKNVTDMYRMFQGCTSLENLNITSFKTTKVRNVKEMFSHCKKLGYLNLSSFDLTNVEDKNAGGMLAFCYSLINIDSPYKIPKNFDYSCETDLVHNCTLGKCVLDDNKDGVADSSTTYNYFLKANKSHRYIFIENIQRVEDAKYHKIEFVYRSVGTTGTAYASPEKAMPGTEVTLTAIPGDKCYFRGWEVMKGGVTIKDNKFIMGDEDVKINCSFGNIPTYYCYVQYGTGDDFYYAGDEVKIVANEYKDYKFKEWVCDDLVDIQFTEGNKYTPEAKFIMPAKRLDIRASYEKVSKSSENVANSDDRKKKSSDTSKDDQNKSSTSKKNNDSKKKNSDDSGSDAKEASEKTSNTLKPTAIKNAKAGKKSITLSWDKNTTSGVKGYEIQYSTSKKFEKKATKKVTIKKVKTTKTTLKKLKSKKTYYIRIRTYKTKNGEKIYSKWSSAKKVKVK